MSRIDAEALTDCSIIVLVRLQRSYDRLVSSSCVAPRTSEHWHIGSVNVPNFTGTGSHVLARQVQVGQRSEQEMA